MEKGGYKIVAVLALIVAVLALTIGFASFSTVLSIQNTSADITPTDIFTPNIQFKQGTNHTPSVTCTNRDGDLESSFVVSKGTLNDNSHATIWGDASVTLKGPGDYVQCAVDIENLSPYVAYLTKVDLDTTLLCNPIGGTTQNLSAACAEIKFELLLPSPNSNAYATSTTVHDVDPVSNVSLASNSYIGMSIRISYSDAQHASTAAVADGDFVVDLPDVTIYGSTQQ